jgi:O-methyltransferase domain/Dimerisation domain
MSSSQAPQATLRQLIDGYRISQMICVAAELGIADVLAAGPRHYAEIARATRADALTLFRLLRALASVDVFARVDGDCFALTPLAEQLQTGVAGSLRPWAVLTGRLYDTWAHLGHSVATGETAFDHLHGISVWDYRSRNPQEGRVFHDAMTANTTLVASAVVDAYDFSRFGTLVDVGGGEGALIQAVLTANPNLHGILFDVPAAVHEAAASFAVAGLAGRCQLLTGSFFESVPAGGDGYILSRILHDWHDDQAIHILQTIRRAMTGGCRLLIVERVVDAEKPSVEAAHTDIHMLVMTGGRERTVAEFQTLLAASDFELVRAIATGSPVQIVEAVPV